MLPTSPVALRRQISPNTAESCTTRSLFELNTVSYAAHLYHIRTPLRPRSRPHRLKTVRKSYSRCHLASFCLPKAQSASRCPLSLHYSIACRSIGRRLANPVRAAFDLQRLNALPSLPLPRFVYLAALACSRATGQQYPALYRCHLHLLASATRSSGTYGTRSSYPHTRFKIGL